MKRKKESVFKVAVRCVLFRIWDMVCYIIKSFFITSTIYLWIITLEQNQSSSNWQLWIFHRAEILYNFFLPVGMVIAVVLVIGDRMKKRKEIIITGAGKPVGTAKIKGKGIENELQNTRDIEKMDVQKIDKILSEKQKK